MRQGCRHICLLLTAFVFALAGACAAYARTPEGLRSGAALSASATSSVFTSAAGVRSPEGLSSASAHSVSESSSLALGQPAADFSASAPSSRALGHFANGAKVNRFVFGAEWGYTASIFNIYHNNYLSPEGIRVDDKGFDFDYSSNGHVLAGVSYAFARKYEAGVYLGFIGVAQDRRLVPLSLRATYYFDSYLKDGLFCYLDGGPAFGENQNVTLIGKLGGGYRMKLSDHFCLDFILSFHLCSDHPKLFYNDDQQITGDDLRRNDATYGGLNFSLALRF